MKFRQALAILVLLSGLGACATYYDDGAYYDDGSYYSPAEGDEGDYYFAPEPHYHHYYNYDLFFGYPYYGHGYFGGWYGSSFYRYDGYCSVRYRYCPPFASYYDHYAPYPRFGLGIQFGDPWYYGRRHYRDGDGYGHGYGRGRGGERWTRPRRPGAPAATVPQPDAGAPAIEPTPEREWQVRQDGETPWPRRQPRRDPRADLEGDGAVSVEVDEPGTPARRWRGPSRRPAAGAPAPRAAAGSPAPRASAPPTRQARSSDSDDEDSPRRSRPSRDTDGRN